MRGATSQPMDPSETARFLDLPDGGKLAYEEYGTPGGQPVFFCHGWPASRLQGTSCAEAASELDIRIISPDRPGIGLSTFKDGRRLIDWPPLLKSLADHLGIERFRVLGLSGGGPYALVSGWALPDRIEAVSVVSGAPPLPPQLDRAALFAVYRWLLAFHRRQPDLVRAFFKVARPFATIRPPRWLRPWLLKTASAADAVTFDNPTVFDEHYKGYREAWHGSSTGVVADAEIYAREWGFPLSEVRVPVRLWHGQEDRNFSWKLAQQVAEKLPNCTAHFPENEGHYSLGIQHWPEILRDLISTK